MAYTNFRNGFSIQTDACVDERLVLTKAQMLTAHNDYMIPAVYFCICSDDNLVYIYNDSNTVDTTIGKFRRYDACTATEVDSKISAAIEKALTETTY